MVYLDYSATTIPDERVVDNFIKNSKVSYNPNSTHKLGVLSREMVDEAIVNISLFLGLKDQEIIFTSGASESNNLAIKGACEEHNIKKIITTKLEHSSINAPISYLMKKGIKLEFCELDNGRVNIEKLINSIGNEKTLVSICAVDSELGIRQPIEDLAVLFREMDNIVFHSDITQCLGKDNVEIEDVDLVSFSSHKIYGFKGIGGLVRKRDLKITPLIHGGKSTSIYRSGTPQTELICSVDDALSLLIPTLKEKFDYVLSLNEKLVDELKKYSNIKINSTDYSIPHILNFSILGKKASDTHKYFSDNDICLSTTSACSQTDESIVVKALYDENRAKSSIRVSLSYKTKEAEVDKFIKVLREYV